jgi:hypothetical protein
MGEEMKVLNNKQAKFGGTNLLTQKIGTLYGVHKY